MRTYVLILLAVVSVVDQAAMAEELLDLEIGNGLLQICTDGDAQLRSLCIGYIAGVRASLLLESSVRAMRESDRLGRKANEPIPLDLGYFCPPEGLSLQQASDIIVKFLRDNPERRHERYYRKLWIQRSAS